MNTLIGIGAGILIIVGVNVWADGHDAEVSRAAQAYQQCVEDQYHMTPIQWYEDHKEYPLCGN